MSGQINAWAYTRGLLCEDNEWTGLDARRRCLAALEAHTQRDGSHLVCTDGSRLELDEFGMFAV